MENILVQQIAMGALSLICILIFLTGLWKALHKTGWAPEKQQAVFLKAVAGITFWIVLLSVLSINKFFDNTAALPPRPAFIFMIGIPVLFLITFSAPFTQILKVTPPHWLIFMQSFRIGVEVLLLLAYKTNLLPIQMTWEGYNYDVLSGLLAIPAGYMIMKQPVRGKTIGILYNLIGLALLICVVTIAILSIPGPLRYFTNDPSVALVGSFPFILLPGVLVLMAAALHIFSLRQLMPGTGKEQSIEKERVINTAI